MIRKLTLAMAWFIALTHASTAASQAPGTATTLDALPRDLEIQLALSALPPHLRDSATVYVLNPATGFEVARKGSNGAHALVARTGDDSFRGTWPLTEYRTDILYPIGFDRTGAAEQMRVFLDAASLQAKGTPPRQLKDTIQARYASGYYKAPARAGVAYMLSPVLRTYTNPDQGEDAITLNVPHVMHFAPHVSNQDIGGSMPSAEEFAYLAQHRHWQGTRAPFVILNGPHGYTVQFLGEAERLALNQEYKEMLARVCGLKAIWCLPDEVMR